VTTPTQKIGSADIFSRPDEFRLRTPLGDRRSCHVVWRTDNELGVRFTDRNEEGLSKKEKEFADR
jgi:hypothetical protein